MKIIKGVVMLDRSKPETLIRLLTTRGVFKLAGLLEDGDIVIIQVTPARKGENNG